MLYFILDEQGFTPFASRLWGRIPTRHIPEGICLSLPIQRIAEGIINYFLTFLALAKDLVPNSPSQSLLDLNTPC